MVQDIPQGRINEAAAHWMGENLDRRHKAFPLHWGAGVKWGGK